jgi:hypothetical protein
MSRRTPENIWRQLVDEAGEDAIERAANVSVEEAERELAAAGFDVAAERAKATAFLDQLESGSPGEREIEKPDQDDRATPSGEQPRVPVDAVAAVEQFAPLSASARGRRRRPRPVVLWLAAAATVTVGAAALVTALQPAPAPHAPRAPTGPPSTPPPSPSVVPSPTAAPDLIAAADLRRSAAAACEAAQWSACLAHLDQARTLDPAGDGDPSVQAIRAQATRGALDESPIKPRKPPKPPKGL